MIKQFKRAWDIITYPEGKDKEFDEECKNAFHKFLDITITIFYLAFIAFGITSTYFLIMHEVVR